MADVIKRIFKLGPGACTNCGHSHSVFTPPPSCRNGYSVIPGGDHGGICTHWGGCKEWCLGIHYAPFPDGTRGAHAIRADDVVVGFEDYTAGELVGPTYVSGAGQPDASHRSSDEVCRCPISDLLSSGHQPGCPEKRR